MSNILELPSIKVKQPMGEFYICSIQARDLCEITRYDFRRLNTEIGFDSYLGIQREVSTKRTKDIAKYIATKDACFPTSVILAIPGNCARYDEKTCKLFIEPFVDEENLENSIPYDKIAIVLDGQHRISGFKDSDYKSDFEINVSIFIDIDISDQAYIFSTVNLAQTKVNKSLVYDLYDLAKKRSPQKLCHNIAIALDSDTDSPFHYSIKRLGVATEGRFNEKITQATFVQSLIKYISDEPIRDRDLYLRDQKPPLADANLLKRIIFRNMFIQEKDFDIVDIIWNYFDAIKKRWPIAWANSGKGSMLNKTNGFKALMRFLRPVYLHLTAPGNVPSDDQFYNIFKLIEFNDDDFNTNIYKPGSAGEAKLFNDLISKSNL